jgi:hypothetical protein
MTRPIIWTSWNESFHMTSSARVFGEQARKPFTSPHRATFSSNSRIKIQQKAWAFSTIAGCLTFEARQRQSPFATLRCVRTSSYRARCRLAGLRRAAILAGTRLSKPQVSECSPET